MGVSSLEGQAEATSILIKTDTYASFDGYTYTNHTHIWDLVNDNLVVVCKLDFWWTDDDSENTWLPVLTWNKPTRACTYGTYLVGYAVDFIDIDRIPFNKGFFIMMFHVIMLHLIEVRSTL